MSTQEFIRLDGPLRNLLLLIVFAAALAGMPSRADEMATVAGPSQFSRNYDGLLQSLVVEPGVLEIFKVRGYQIFYIEFQNQAAQSQSLDRIGIFVESDEYHGKILAPQRMATLDAEALFDGHDYAGEDVARFYTKAEKLVIRLNPMEQRLKDLLFRVGAIAEGEGEYVSPQPTAVLAAVAGMDERHGAGTRRWVLDHEFRHGYYFVTLKPGVHEIWQTMLSAREREIVASALTMTARYNPKDASLMEREFHAMIFEGRFEDDLMRLTAPWSDAPSKAKVYEVEILIAKLPGIRRALLALERRLHPLAS